MATSKSPLEIRVDILEQEVEGEKMVTRYILEQTRRNGDDLAILKSRVERVEGKVDGLEGKVDGLERKVDGLAHDLGALRADVHGLRDALPRMIADTMREVFAERDRRA